MIEIRETASYRRWYENLRDGRAQRRIATKIVRLAHGNVGDTRPVGEAVSELRIDYGPGYRVYFMQKGLHLVLLLAGGNKQSQSRDIERALELARNIRRNQ